VSYNGYALLSTQFTANVTGGASVPTATTMLTLTPTVYEYALPASANPYHMAVGPDKQIWVALFGAEPGLYHFVPVPPGQATLNGTLLSTSQGMLGVTAGADGNVWFDDWSYAVYKVPPTGTPSDISTYTTPYNKPNNLVDGGDGNMYVAYSYFYGPNYIPENTAPGSFTPIGTNFGGGGDIVVGSDKRVWSGDGQQGCCYVEYIQGIPTGISANQTTSTFDFGGGLAGAGITWVAAGADGNIWYSIRDGNIVGHISTNATSVSQAVTIQMAAGSAPFTLAAGPDGYMYIDESGTNKIGRMPVTATSGNLGLSEYLAPSATGQANGIITGPDGNIWFDEPGPSNIGKLAL
jgi:virginiamycin B lyase